MATAKPRRFETLILSALVIRLVFASVFFHPDIKSHYFHAQFLERGIVDIYGHMAANTQQLPYHDSFNYPPLTYYLLGGWQTVARLVSGPALSLWLNDWGPGGYSHPRMFEFMLVLKLPYLLVDFLVLALLLRINRLAGTRSNRQTDPYRLAGFWLFNPVSLYSIYALSQFDIVCALLTVAALYLVISRRIFFSAVMLGLGTAIKSYPVLLLPFVLFRAAGFKQAVSGLAGFLLAVLLPVLPVLASPAFRYTMTHSNLMQRIFAAGIDIGGNQSLPVYVCVYVLAGWFSWNRRKSFDLLPEFLTLTLSVLLFSHFHAQWAVWPLPFLALLFARRPGLWPVLAAAAAGLFAVNILLPDQYAFLGLLAAINPQTIFFPPLPEMLKPFTDPDLLQSLAHALLAASGLWLIFSAWQNHDEK